MVTVFYLLFWFFTFQFFKLYFSTSDNILVDLISLSFGPNCMCFKKALQISLLIQGFCVFRIPAFSNAKINLGEFRPLDTTIELRPWVPLLWTICQLVASGSTLRCLEQNLFGKHCLHNLKKNL